MQANWKRLFQIYYLALVRYPTRKRYITAAYLTALGLPLCFINHLGLSLDSLLFPGFKKRKIAQPVFIFGNPRSGTTFLHRVLSGDKKNFYYYKTFELMFPALSIRKPVISLLSSLDSLLDQKLSRFMKETEAHLFRGINHIHKFGLQAAEEDEALFLYLFESAHLFLLYPFFDELEGLESLDDDPSEERKKELMAYYEQCLKRQAYTKDPSGNQFFLSKNPSFVGKFRSAYDYFPDSKFVYLVRNPFEMLPSALSLFHTCWKGTTGAIDPISKESRHMADAYIRYYKVIEEVLPTLDQKRCIIIKYDDLIEHPKEKVKEIYERFGLEIDAEFEKRLDEEEAKHRKYKSSHDYTLEYFGLNADEIYKELEPIFKKYNFSTSR
jgi:hypothetical protein